MMKKDTDINDIGLALAAVVLIGLGTNFYLGFGVVALVLFMKGK